MTTITLHTPIEAPLEKVFDLSRNIDFHMESASHTNEKAIDGTTHGLIGFGETVTWRGKHFGLYLKHSSNIIDFERPSRFTDIMIKGHFKYFCHQHFFESKNNLTIMTDVLKYRVPYGFFGKFFDRLLLEKHLIGFLKHRNSMLKISVENTST